MPAVVVLAVKRDLLELTCSQPRVHVEYPLSYIRLVVAFSHGRPCADHITRRVADHLGSGQSVLTYSSETWGPEPTELDHH